MKKKMVHPDKTGVILHPYLPSFLCHQGGRWGEVRLYLN